MVFPDNPAAGQACFAVYAAQGNEPEISQFDIQGGGMHVVFHYTVGNGPGGVKLMQWEQRDGKPCLEESCGAEIPVKRETYAAPGEPGWAYDIITPREPLNLSSISGGYIGITMGTDKYIPLFH